ncbi:transmembrane protein 104-like [Daphnia pulex]|uniref:transmembrane protein 104-like n=1 Tax=Daphnia pulex TaxID=6669 RepID=UPI001EE12B7F|nr:transmembrane protein 104-like [Daphnia pulex]XP_046458222.1 transmembrane protein 104-like [Daphnia pulex]
MARNTESSTYPPSIGLVYVFNLIVGTGALTLPAAFANAGWIVSLSVILALSAISYITLTFVVESMAAANAILRSKRAKQLIKKESLEHSSYPQDDSDSDESESPAKSLLERVKVRKTRSLCSSPNLYSSVIQSEDYDHPTTSSVINENSDFIVLPHDNDLEECDIQETIEMGKLAHLFFNRGGTILFFICITIYLYGDLAIYGAAVGKSLRDTACTYFPVDVPCNETLNGTVACWEGSDLTRDNAYRLFLSIFVLLIGAFGFFNVQKTLLLQILTGLVRWTAFIAMIILACVRLLSSPKENQGHPPVANVNGLPNLFGACVYSFMCHHSLPSLVTPISPKRGLYKLLALDYFMIAGFYLLLGFTGMFAFPHLEDLYTLNFVPNRCPSDPASNFTASILDAVMPKEAVTAAQQALFYFLTLFPVFTLSTSFPIITITLRNNLKQLFLRRNEADYNFFVRRLLFPLLALIPPTVLAIITSDISFLVGITGSYAGAAVQYIIPALLVFYARKAIKKEFLLEPVRNAFASPFRHTCFVLFVLLWSCASIGFVTYNHLMADK